MNENYESQLSSGTEKMMKYLSSSGADEGERQAVITAYTNMLAEHVGNSEAISDSEKLIYDTSLLYLDKVVSGIVGNLNASYSDYERALSYCGRISDLMQLYTTRGWMLPSLTNRDIIKSKSVLTQRMESTSIASKIAEEDKEIDTLLSDVQIALDVKTCDRILSLLDDLDADMQTCKQRKMQLPVISNRNTKKVAKKVTGIRKIAEQKETLHQKTYDLDAKIHTVVSMANSSPDNWRELIDCCQKQKAFLAECSKKQWPMPTLRYEDLDSLTTQYKHYLAMDELDNRIYSSREHLSSNKQYRNFSSDCEKQCSNIKICQENGWRTLNLRVPDPGELLIHMRERKSKRDKAKKRKHKIILAFAVVIVIGVASCFGVIKWREGKIKIPFDATYVAGADMDTIYAELTAAGFENISKHQDASGWMNDGEVISVSIDNRDEYKKDKYIDPAVSVIITYSSSGRIYVTDILKGWSEKPYSDVQKILTDAGFTNITTAEVETSNEKQDKLAAGLELNDLDYTNEYCYLPKNAPIVLSYYTLKYGIGNENDEFVGQNYEVVVRDFEDIGFNNIQTEEISTGWAEGNTVVGVTVDNKDTYSSSDSFAPDVRIVVKYSSNDRIDITETLKGWSGKDFDSVQTALKKTGMTNVTVKPKKTERKSQNLKVASIAINKANYSDGGCFVQKSADIEIEYYKLSIKIGKKESDLTANTEGNYSSVIDELEEKGFTDISVYRSNSLINGWITKEGSVKSISINGVTDFSDTDSFDYDAPIVIIVNTFKDKGCEDITEIWND